MGLGQPDMQRYHSRLGGEPEKGEEEGGGSPSDGIGRRPHGVEGVPLKTVETIRHTGHHAEREEYGDGAHVGDDEVQVCRTPVFRFLVLVHDEEIGRGRHQFPRHEKEECVVGKHDQQHAGDEKGKEDDEAHDRPARRQSLDIADRVDGDEKDEEADDAEEETGELVEAQVERKVGQPEGQDGGDCRLILDRQHPRRHGSSGGDRRQKE